MSKRFKEKFDEYELIFTPILLIFSILVIYFYLPQVLYLDNYLEIFLIPSTLGNVFGIILTFLLDKYWKKVDNKSITNFIRLPTLILILFASVSVLLVQYDAYLAFSLLGIGLGSLLSLICITSILTYYRSYYVPKKASKIK